MYNYEAARLTATKLITKFGGAGQFVRKGNSGGFDDDGNVIAPTADEVNTGIITPLLSYESSEINGQNIQTGDAYVYFDSNVKVSINSVTTLNGKEYRAVSVDTLESVGDVLVYQKVQLRR